MGFVLCHQCVPPRSRSHGFAHCRQAVANLTIHQCDISSLANAHPPPARSRLFRRPTPEDHGGGLKLSLAVPLDPSMDAAAKSCDLFPAMPEKSPLYDRDLFAWSRQQAELLRAGNFAQADMEDLAEEIDGMGRTEKRELISRLSVLPAAPAQMALSARQTQPKSGAEHPRAAQPLGRSSRRQPEPKPSPRRARYRRRGVRRRVAGDLPTCPWREQVDAFGR